jgi:hypothetical protein
MQIPAFPLFQDSYRQLRHELLPRASRAAAMRCGNEPLISTMTDKGSHQRGAA